MKIKIIAAIVAVSTLKEERKQFFVCHCQQWEAFADQLTNKNAFRRYYCMEKESFLRLTGYLKPIIF
jgi:hypothetical protein